MGRTTKDLIDEMNGEKAKGFTLLAIIVGFENRTVFVFDSDPEPLRKLNELVKDGGEPIGLSGIRRIAKKVDFLIRPFTEYEGKDWVKG